MKRINQKFFEEYNQMDKLCRERFGTERGISDYIDEMQGIYDPRSRGYEPVLGWSADYKILKHLRYVRNKLAHEAGAFDEDWLEDGDMESLSDLYKRLSKGTDPLTMYEKKKRARKNAQSNRPVASAAEKQWATATSNKNKPKAAKKALGLGKLVLGVVITAAIAIVIWKMLH